MPKFMISFAFLATAAFAGPALAQTATTENSARAMPVRYNDLDLRQSADAAALLSRLRQAAVASCAPDQATQSNARIRRAIDRCRDQAVASAVAQINQEELTRLHAAQRR